MFTQNSLLRIFLLFMHGLANIILLSYLTDMDITGSWLTVVLFAGAVLLLLFVLIFHVVSFIQFIKTQTK